MDRKDLTTLVLRLLGIYGLVMTLQHVLHMVVLMFDWPEEVRGWQVVEPFVLSSALGWGTASLVLLLGGRRIAGWLTRSSESETSAPPLPIDAKAIRLVGFQLLGAYMLASQAESVFQFLEPFFRSATADPFSSPSWSSWQFAYVAQFLGVVLIGAYLLFGARGLAELVDRVRGAGLQSEEKAWKTPRA